MCRTQGQIEVTDLIRRGRGACRRANARQATAAKTFDFTAELTHVLLNLVGRSTTFDNYSRAVFVRLSALQVDSFVTSHNRRGVMVTHIVGGV